MLAHALNDEVFKRLLAVAGELSVSTGTISCARSASCACFTSSGAETDRSVFGAIKFTSTGRVVCCIVVAHPLHELFLVLVADEATAAAAVSWGEVRSWEPGVWRQQFPVCSAWASTLGVAKAEADAPDSKSDSSTELPLISSGSWYYEAVLLSSGLMQIGWVDDSL